MLGWSDNRIVGVVLEALDAILKVGEAIKEQECVNFNPFIQLIEEVFGSWIADGLVFIELSTFARDSHKGPRLRVIFLFF